MTPQETKDAIRYWTKTAEHDYDTMIGLFGIERYSDCLFYGHILLEKTLKALVVQTTKEQPPYIHDLVRLAQTSQIELDEKNIKFLNEMNRFNIRARYPDYKLKIYSLCTKSYTKKLFLQIQHEYEILCQILKQKK